MTKYYFSIVKLGNQSETVFENTVKSKQIILLTIKVQLFTSHPFTDVVTPLGSLNINGTPVPASYSVSCSQMRGSQGTYSRQKRTQQNTLMNLTCGYILD